MTPDTSILTTQTCDYRITKVVAGHLEMHLPHPYVMASVIMHHADTVMMEITATSGDKAVTGYGEGAPYHSCTAHELAPDVLKYIETIAGPQILNKDPVALLLEDKYTSHPDPDHMVALSATDIALWDLYGKLAGKPVCDLLGRVRDGADVLWPVSSANSLLDDIQVLEEKVAKGFHSFMIKCGSHPDVQTDIDRVVGCSSIHFPVPSNSFPMPTKDGTTNKQTSLFKPFSKRRRRIHPTGWPFWSSRSIEIAQWRICSICNKKSPTRS